MMDMQILIISIGCWGANRELVITLPLPRTCYRERQTAAAGKPIL